MYSVYQKMESKQKARNENQNRQANLKKRSKTKFKTRQNEKYIHQKLKTTTYVVHFLMVIYSAVWGPPWCVVDRLSETSLRKIDMSLSHQLQITS